MKMFITFLIGLVFIFSLSACASGNTPDIQDTTGKEKSSSENIDSSEPVTISMVAGPWQEYAANIDRLFALYKESHPNVTIEYITDATILNARIASKSYPELFINLSYNNLSPYLEYLTDLTDSTIWSEIQESVFGSVTFDGKRYAVPLNTETYGLIYNKDLFEAAGFTEPPKTFSQFKKLCENLVANGVTPLGLGFKENWILSQFLLFPFGGSQDYATLASSICTGETALKDTYFYQNYKQFVDYALLNCQAKVLEGDYTTQVTLFAAGEVAMISNGDWTAGMINEIDPEVKYGMMGMPYTEDEDDYKIYVCASNTISSFKDSPNAAEGLKFIEWLVGTKEGKGWIGSDWKMATPVKNVEVELNALSLDGMAAVSGGYAGSWGDVYFPGEANPSYSIQLQKYILGEVDWNTMMDNISAEIVKYATPAK